jgi:small-conductance mechanosensitive channel
MQNKNVITITKGLVYVAGLMVIVVCAVLVPELAREEAAGRINPPESRPFLIGVWILAIPVFVALFHTRKLLKYLEQGKAFSKKSVRALGYIKYSAVIFAVMIALSAIAIRWVTYNIDPTEDSAPVGAFGIIFTN